MKMRLKMKSGSQRYNINRPRSRHTEYTKYRICVRWLRVTTQKMKFFIKDFFCKCDQIRRKLRIWSHLLMENIYLTEHIYLMENLFFVQWRIHWRLIFGSAEHCSRLRLWIVYFIYFKFTPVFLYLMFSIDFL